MKIGIVGINFKSITDDPYNFLIGNRVRTWALFDLLKQYGYETKIFVDRDAIINNEIETKHGQDFIRNSEDFISENNKGEFDYVLLASTKLELIVNNHPWLSKLNRQNIIGVFCYFNTTIKGNLRLRSFHRKMKAVTFITPLQNLIWNKVHPSIPSFTITTGQTPQGKLTKKKTLDTIFIGEIRSLNHLKKFIEIAAGLPDRNHYLVTTRIVEQAEANRVHLDLLKHEPQKRKEIFYEFLKSSGIVYPINLLFEDIKYGEETELLNSCGFGIDFSWGWPYEIENTKVNRYLSYGLIPIVEMQSPSYRYLNWFNVGKTIEYSACASTWIEEIKAIELLTKKDTDIVREKAGIEFDWNNLAHEINSIIQGFELIKSNSTSRKYRMRLKLRSLFGV